MMLTAHRAHSNSDACHQLGVAHLGAREEAPDGTDTYNLACLSESTAQDSSLSLA